MVSRIEIQIFGTVILVAVSFRKFLDNFLSVKKSPVITACYWHSGSLKNRGKNSDIM